MLANIRDLQQYDPLKFGPSSMIMLSFPAGLDEVAASEVATDPFGDVFVALVKTERPDGAKEKLLVNEFVGSLSHNVA
jgi:hypothetical protein